MKNLLFLLVLAPILTFGNPLPNLEGITNAIKNGDAVALGQYFDSMVEIAILDDEDMYSKAEAIKKVKAFFAKVGPKSFSQVHQGTSKGRDAQYCIGNLTANTGVYRVYIYVKVTNNKEVIQELRIDKN